LTGKRVTLVDYTDGNFLGPSPLEDLLTPGTELSGYRIQDTGSRIVLIPPPGTVLTVW
jgi:hypothetical protein